MCHLHSVHFTPICTHQLLQSPIIDRYLSLFFSISNSMNVLFTVSDFWVTTSFICAFFYHLWLLCHRKTWVIIIKLHRYKHICISIKKDYKFKAKKIMFLTSFGMNNDLQIIKFVQIISSDFSSQCIKWVKF